MRLDRARTLRLSLLAILLVQGCSGNPEPSPPTPSPAPKPAATKPSEGSGTAAPTAPSKGS